MGAIFGAIIGLVAAMLLQRSAEKNESELTLKPGERLKLGALIVGLLRGIATLGDD